MAVAMTLQKYLDQQGIDYKTLSHPHAESSMATAQAAHVPGDQLAKAVIVKDQDRYLMVVLPADYHVHLGRLRRYLGHEVGLATEQEVQQLFADCETGAIPPLGAAYDLDSLVDNHVLAHDDVFFESGDHQHLIKVSTGQFATLLDRAARVDVGRHL